MNVTRFEPWTLMNLLKEKGIITTDEMRRCVEEIYSQTPQIGARVVARAWVDEGFRERLLTDARGACDEMGIDTSAVNKLIALENTDETHYMVVCTLCSCYPRVLLGQPPTWYKSYPYRSKAVTDGVFAKENEQPNDPEALATTIADAVEEVVRRQVEVGVDVVSDGEMSKISYATYIKDRITGFEGDSERNPPADLEEFPGFLQRQASSGGTPSYRGAAAANVLTSMGFRNVSFIDGGMAALTAAGSKTIKP